jgi:hypothetical protein
VPTTICPAEFANSLFANGRTAVAIGVANSCEPAE